MSYYRWQNSYSGWGGSFGISPVVKMIMLINVGAFLLVNIFSGLPWCQIFGLVPRYVFFRFMVWQLGTYLFVHVALGHLAVNMLMLFFFGPALEQSWGGRKFLTFYFFTGVGAALCSFVTAFSSPVPVIGASGAIFGIMVAYAMMFPETTLLMFFVFPMKIKHAVIFLAGINLLGALTNPGSGIAYFAHLGGGLCGYLYLKQGLGRFRVPLSFFTRIKAFFKNYIEEKRRMRDALFEQKVDRILDKVSQHGIESLTPQEREILRQRSRGN